MRSTGFALMVEAKTELVLALRWPRTNQDSLEP
jgi:hypothetical protein